MRNDSILANQQIFANFEFVGREALVAHRPSETSAEQPDKRQITVHSGHRLNTHPLGTSARVPRMTTLSELEASEDCEEKRPRVDRHTAPRRRPSIT